MLRVQISIICVLLVSSVSAFSQSTSPFIIKGTITELESGEPMSFATVFLSSTTYGTVSDPDGIFNLEVDQQGTYDLIVKFSGYKTFVRSVKLFDSPVLEIDVALEPDVRNLADFTVTAEKDELWRRNLEDFKRGFLGTSEFAQECKILNEEDIDFYFDKTNNIYETYAREPLIIENKALGYKIKYILEEYKVYMSENYVRFYGFPVFEEMKEGKKPKKKWLENREIAYNGSIDHFFSALYSNSLTSEGYQVHPAKDVDGTRYFR